jgi:hypothetical protein
LTTAPVTIKWNVSSKAAVHPRLVTWAVIELAYLGVMASLVMTGSWSLSGNADTQGYAASRGDRTQVVLLMIADVQLKCRAEWSSMRLVRPPGRPGKPSFGLTPNQDRANLALLFTSSVGNSPGCCPGQRQLLFSALRSHLAVRFS